MRVDYTKRAEVDVDQRYRDNRARGDLGWASQGDEYEKAVARLEVLAQEYGARGGRMLEMGCGAGDIALLAAQRGLFDEIHAVDISKEAIAWARAKAEQRRLDIEFAVANAVDLRDYSDRSFHAVVDFACLHWIIGDDRRDCLASVRRVLKPGGLYYLWSQCRNPEVELKEKHYVEEDIYFDPESSLLVRHGLPYFHLKPPDEILSEIKDAGFDVVHREMWEVENEPYQAGPLVAVAVKPR